MMTRADILRDYRVNEHGIITSPGKYEGEMLYVPMLWDALLMGEGDGFVDDDDSSERIRICEDDLAEFPELAGVVSVILSESSYGFVYCIKERVIA